MQIALVRATVEYLHGYPALLHDVADHEGQGGVLARFQDHPPRRRSVGDRLRVDLRIGRGAGGRFQRGCRRPRKNGIQRWHQPDQMLAGDCMPIDPVKRLDLGGDVAR